MNVKKIRKTGAPLGGSYKFLLLELGVFAPEFLAAYYYYTPDAPRRHAYYFRYDSPFRHREDVYIVLRKAYGRAYHVVYYDVPTGEFDYIRLLRFRDVAKYMIERFKAKQSRESEYLQRVGERSTLRKTTLLRIVASKRLPK